MITLDKEDVYLNDLKIGRLIKDGTMFYAHKSYERHLYRILNSFGLNEDAFIILNFDKFVVKVDEKYLGISSQKIKELMAKFNCIVKYDRERQIMIPVILMDLKADNIETKEGKSIEQFTDIIDDPRGLYCNWKGRKK